MMASSKRFLLLITFTNLIISFDHLTGASPAYKYESTLNLSVALTIMMPFGTPTQWKRVVLDTGSQLTWLQCRSGGQGHPSFRTNDSSSFSTIACHDASCLTNQAETTDLSLPMSCTHRLCRYDYTFADQSTSSGNLVREKSNLGNSQITPPLVMGCSPKKDTATGADGMLGMNRGSLSFISQTRITKFSYCVPKLAKNSGTFHLGDSPYSKSFRYISLLNTTLESQPMASLDPFAYYVRLVGIKIRGEKLNIGYDRFEVCPGQTMIDSGTQYTYLVEAAYAAVRNKVVSLTSKYMKQKGPDLSSEFDMCFDPKSNLSDIMEKIGDVVLEFDDGVEVTIAKETTLHNISGHGVCLAFGRSERLSFITNVFGIFYQQNHCLEFRGDRVGFGNAS